MWNFYDHIRLGIEELIATQYGKGAYDYLTSLHPLSPTNSLDKAIFLRETVRGYNGGREFVYEDGQWIMRPWLWVKEKGKPARKAPLNADSRPYANNVLGTGVKYATPPRHEDRVAQDNLGNIAGTMESLL
jgi:hypothetical protein